ncbi:hypothetical protein CPT_Mano_043 [Achromobacter phage Mano]|uniref:Uncharacterized protein n=1 Tax=Achromobacter phage Mano TaxID=2767570 RepID=A0A7L8G6J0_9CAUD|nr:hypothetical protein KB680_gp48 [Achromobacter phage Mano]QOE32775.1 hypothetical protein CPT_Mano_043 [Achromobacter phage Mano]
MSVFRDRYNKQPVLVVIDARTTPGSWKLTAFRGRQMKGQAILDSRGIGPWEAAAIVEDYRASVAETTKAAA